MSVATPQRGDGSNDLVLPSNIQAIEETAIYARANGYIRERSVDIGDRVTAGKVLAQIDTPELDQELSQSRAALAQTRSGLAQAQASLTQARANLQQARAGLEQSRANEGLAAPTQNVADMVVAEKGTQASGAGLRRPELPGTIAHDILDADQRHLPDLLVKGHAAEQVAHTYPNRLHGIQLDGACRPGMHARGHKATARSEQQGASRCRHVHRPAGAGSQAHVTLRCADGSGPSSPGNLFKRDDRKERR